MDPENANAGVGDSGVLQVNCSRQKEPALDSQSESRAQAPRKNESLRCPICERRFQRRASDADSHVEVWLEKDALAGVVMPITSLYDVPLMVARGYASLSFLHSAAEYINQLEVPTYIYHLGDFDPSGVNAGEKIDETLREMAPSAEIHFERLAVTPEQIKRWQLPTRPTKTSDTRSKGFGKISVELDAISPVHLRVLVEQAINRHLPQDQLHILKAAEASERQVISSLIGGLTL